MNAVRLSGRDIAEKIYQTLQSRVDALQSKNITPHLVVFLIGENPASVAYVRQKQTKGEAIGCKVTVLELPETVTNEELETKIKELNDDQTVHGILIQRPVPEQIDIDKLELLTNPKKDIDGFHPDAPYTFPIPLAVMKILEEVFELKNERGMTENKAGVAGVEDHHRAPATNVRTSDGGNARQDPVGFLQWLQSQNIVVIGKGSTGGEPVIKYLQTLHINPTVITSKTPNPDELLKNADVIISAVGKENIINPASLKQGVILIGVGILRGADGKLHGDYNETEVDSVASYYTPTPGGVGPVNVAMLLDNLLTATEKQTA